MNIIERMKVRWRIAGWKTKLGNLTIAAGGVMYISSLWCPVLIDRVSIGTVIVGWAISRHGTSNRLNRAFYSLDENGNPDLNRPRHRKARTQEGELYG